MAYVSLVALVACVASFAIALRTRSLLNSYYARCEHLVSVSEKMSYFISDILEALDDATDNEIEAEVIEKPAPVKKAVKKASPAKKSAPAKKVATAKKVANKK